MSEAEWEAWDEQIKEDLETGRLDKLLDEVDEQHRQGLTLPVCEGKRKFDQAHTSTRSAK